MRIHPPYTSARVCLVLLAAVVVGCGDPQVRREIIQTQTVSPHRKAIRSGATSNERFGHALTPSGMPRTDSFLQWQTPEGWKAAPSSNMRLINFRVGPQGEAECYVTILPGAAGGVAANVNRWRGQLGLEPSSESDIAKLPTLSLLGQEAVFVSLDGTFSGMGDTVPKKDYRLFGLIGENQGHMQFVKMTGPRKLLEAEAENFAIFCASIAPASPNSTGEEKITAVRKDQELGWSTPASWRPVDHPSTMRLATFACGTVPDVECYVTVLDGDGGGTAANINRWCRQLGKPPLTEDELAALPRLTVLGQPSPLVTVSGDYQGMGGEAQSGALMSGVVCALPGQVLFVKMIGPQAAARAQVDNFVAFAESLQMRHSHESE
jgi:hypothetical protein